MKCISIPHRKTGYQVSQKSDKICLRSCPGNISSYSGRCITLQTRLNVQWCDTNIRIHMFVFFVEIFFCLEVSFCASTRFFFLLFFSLSIHCSSSFPLYKFVGETHLAVSLDSFWNLIECFAMLCWYEYY